ncbi:hypothetical protein WISP_46177 [Willisornis vidua]|uniref:Uncharacterized protein n=1 Tax=Willisornis vidua TaxID=1566151 RepID=A0ABQ9DKG7_9PASS|nr:hypothetical protein WISP_46177 [Willisornis vidua]
MQRSSTGLKILPRHKIRGTGNCKIKWSSDALGQPSLAFSVMPTRFASTSRAGIIEHLLKRCMFSHVSEDTLAFTGAKPSTELDEPGKILRKASPSHKADYQETLSLCCGQGQKPGDFSGFIKDMGIIISLPQLIKPPTERIFWQPETNLTRTVTDGRAFVDSINNIDFHIGKEMN